MKALIAMICIGFLLLGFSDNKNIKKKEKVPPGTVRLNDNLFIDKNEVANIHWREFMYWLESKKDSIGFENSKIDSMVWINVEGHGDYSSYYFRHPMFNYRPVVGVDYEQAVAFCNWRSDRVNELYSLKPEMNPFPNKKYRYRLPTKFEWELAASGKLSVDTFPFGAISTMVKRKSYEIQLPFFIRKKENQYYSFRCNYSDLITNPKNMKDDLIAINDSYSPNSYNLYHMIGNVSEMVSSKGIAKGGNFLLPLDSCKIKMEQHYTKPEVWLGFRCVCEIIKE